MNLIQGLTISSLNFPSLVFDGTNYILTEVSGLESPLVRLPRYNLPGASGAYISNALYGERAIKIKGIVNAPNRSRATYLNNRIALINAISYQRDTNDTISPQTLTFTMENGFVLTLQAYVDTPLSMGFTPEQPDYEEFLITFVAPDPALYSSTATTGSINLPVGGGVAIPTAIPISLAPSSGGSLVLNNPGSFNAYPIITLSAPLTNPFITNTKNGAFLKINDTLNVGDQSLVINCQTQTILQGNSDVTGIQSSDSTFWQILPGNNTIKFSAAAGSGTASISFNAAYLGA